MKITVIHGVNHKGSTYNISKRILDNLCDGNTKIYEFFMPKHAPNFCTGCLNCISNGEENCPHYESVNEIVLAMEKSDIIIVDSPTYVMEMTGQLKVLFDHLAYLYIVHRPNMRMFSKVAIVVSTAAGAGANKVTKSLASQMHFLSVPKVFRYSQNVHACKFEEVSDKLKAKIDIDSVKIAKKTLKALDKSKPTIKQNMLLRVTRLLHKKGILGEKDSIYWDEMGLTKGSPWKKTT